MAVNVIFEAYILVIGKDNKLTNKWLDKEEEPDKGSVKH